MEIKFTLGFNEVSFPGDSGMSRRYLDHMIEELELSNFAYYQKWYSAQNPVCYTLPDLQRDFRSARPNRCDFYPVDYYRQLYWMPQNFILPGYEPLCFLRRSDKKGFPSKVQQYGREKRNCGEKRYFHNRQEKEVDRIKRCDILSQFERRLQSNWERDVAPQHYQMSRDDRNTHRLSFRNSSMELCPEDILADHRMKHFKQTFDTRNPSEYLAFKKDVKVSGEYENGAYAESFRTVHYSNPAAADWQEQGPKVSESHLSSNESYKMPADFGNNYESWYCPEEQQQIVDMLKDVNLRHDIQLQRDILSSRGEPPCSDDSITSNNDSNSLDQLQKSVSSDDEEDGINIILSPRGSSPIAEVTNKGESELKSDYFEKSASDFFEEFQNIFTSSPEKQIFNNLTKESFKRPSNLFFECGDDFELLGKTITDEDRDAVKSVLNFEILDDVPENSLKNLSDTTFSSPKEISSKILSEQTVTVAHKESESTCGIPMDASLTDSEQKILDKDVLKKPFQCENYNHYVDKGRIISNNYSFTNFEDLNKDKISESKSNYISKEKQSDNQNNISMAANKIRVDFQSVSELENMKDTEKNLKNKFKEHKTYSSAKKSYNKKCSFNMAYDLNNRFEHAQVRNNFSAEEEKLHCEKNGMKSFQSESFVDKSGKIYQRSTTCTRAKSANMNSEDCQTTVSASTVSGSQPHSEKCKVAPLNCSPVSEPFLNYEREETIYKRISVSEIFKASNVESSMDMQLQQSAQEHARQFMEQFNPETTLSPSAHLKLILGIGTESKDLNEKHVHGSDNFTNKNTAEKYSPQLSIIKTSKPSNFRYSGTVNTKTYCSNHNLYKASIPPNYPYCEISKHKENIITRTLEKDEDFVYNSLKGMDLKLTKYPQTLGKNKTNNEIEISKENKLVGNYSEQLKCKTNFKQTDYFQKKYYDIASESRKADLPKILISPKLPNDQEGDKNGRSNQTPKEGGKIINKHKHNASKNNYGPKEKYGNTFVTSSVKMNETQDFADYNAKNIKQNEDLCLNLNTLDMNKTLPKNVDSKFKCNDEPPKLKKKWKKKKKDKLTAIYNNENSEARGTCLPNHVPNNNTISSEYNERQIYDTSGRNEQNVLSQNNKVSSNSKGTNRKIMDRHENSFTKSVDKTDSLAMNKNKNQSENENGKESISENNQTWHLQPALETSASNDVCQNIFETQKKSKLYYKERRDLKFNCRSLRTKEYISSTEKESNDFPIEACEKNRYSKNFNSKQHRIPCHTAQSQSVKPQCNDENITVLDSKKCVTEILNNSNENAKFCENKCYTSSILIPKNLLGFKMAETIRDLPSSALEFIPPQITETVNREKWLAKVEDHKRKAKKHQYIEVNKNNARKRKCNEYGNTTTTVNLLTHIPAIHITSFQNKMLKTKNIALIDERQNIYLNASNKDLSDYNSDLNKMDPFVHVPNVKVIFGLNSLKKFNLVTASCSKRIQNKNHILCCIADYDWGNTICCLLKKNCSKNLQMFFYYLKDTSFEIKKYTSEGSVLTLNKSKVLKLAQHLRDKAEVLVILVSLDTLYEAARFIPFKINHSLPLNFQIPLLDIIPQISTVHFSKDFKDISELSLNALLTENIIGVLPLFLRYLSILSYLQVPWCQNYLKEIADFECHERFKDCLDPKNYKIQRIKEKCVSDILKCWKILHHCMCKIVYI